MKTSKKDFIAEAEDIIESATSSLLELQASFNPDALNSLFRAIHTMKGLSGLFGFKGFSDLCHTLESLLDDLRLGRIEFNDETIGFIFSNIDLLKNLVDQVSQDKEVGDVSDAVRSIESFRDAMKSRAQASAAAPQDASLKNLSISPSILNTLSEYEEHRLKTNIKEGKIVYMVKSVFELTTFDKGIESLNSNLKSIGEVIATLPSSQGVPDGSIGFTQLFGSSSGIENVKETAQSAEVEMILPLKTVPGPADVTVKAKEVTLKSAANTVRVDIEKLDRILNTVSELVLAKGAVIRIQQELAGSYGYTPLTLDLYKISQILDRKLAELQDNILELRMVPFSQIFSRLAQVVRRHIKEVNKEIDLKIFGEDTEIDKVIAEDIIDPLIHLIRNSIDHGIEVKERRLALGKKEHGTITLKAFPKGNNVIITLQDDGAGLDIDKILHKARENKLIPENQDIDRREIINLIFLPGLSTKESVSEVSGRGIGMNIVKEKIGSLGGFVDIETEKDAGTTFTITLPITLAIIKTILIKVANEHFIIPLTSVAETFIVDPSKIQTIEGREVIEIRNKILPLLRIDRTLLLEEKPRDEYFGIVVGTGDRQLGLLVDDLLGQTEVVVKPLGEFFKNTTGVAGAAEIGKHEVVLVLDIETMMKEAFLIKNDL
ncbi:MAG: chemotaxis protein CheA [Nitrospirae bacterium]|nr:chemotaxis protein CheA [Nitrospirota bacterium]